MVSVHDFKRVLFDQKTIEARVQELAEQIVEDYKYGELVILTVQKGGARFSSDLVRAMVDYSLRTYNDVVVDILETDVKLSRRPNPKVFLPEPVMLLPLDPNIGYEGRPVLVVEDIVDQGVTMRYLLDRIQERNPQSVSVCTLLDKPSQRTVDIPVGYKGFEVENVFVAGYGLDVNEKYRHFPFIGELKQEVIDRLLAK
ncbi:hypoxanthine phosphoribosyltransferase [Candidatus Woesearchaeota archaeon]|nr:hypoxanthine phosphoribosyltransferase [Candidatus Woesearchaeota archaeon]